MSTIKAGTTTTTAFSVDQDTTGDLNFQAGSVTPLSIKSTGLVSVSNTASFKLPVGTIAQRPASPQNGMMRFNSDLNEVEVYSAGGWQVISSGNLKLKLDFDETTTLDSRISFTRATNGTYFSSTGLLTTAGSGVARFDHRLESGVWVSKGLMIEEARTNLLQRSEEINDTYWTKTNVTITTNNTTAPDGNSTAEKMNETTTNGGHWVIGPNSGSLTISANTPYTLSVFVKYDTNSTTQRNLYLTWTGPGGTNAVRGYFNLVSKTTFTQAVGSATNLSSRIEDVGNGWLRCSVTGVVDSSTTLTNPIIGFSTLDNFLSYAGQTGNAFWIWGAQFEAGSTVSSYIATTASAATRNQDVVSMTGTNFSSWFNSSEGTVYCSWSNIGLNPVNNYVWQIDPGDGTSAERYYLITTNTGAFHDVIDNNVSQTTGLNSSYTPTLLQNYTSVLGYKVNDFAASFNGNSTVTDTSGTLPTVARLVLGEAQTTATRPLNGHIAKFYYWNTRRTNQVLQNLTE